MAKRSKASKLQPAVETLTFSTPNLSPGYNGRFYIDLGRAASEVNRRAYRQGRQWMVAGFTFLSSGTGSIGVTKLPVTWVTANAWEKTFRAWDAQQMKAIKDAGAQSTVSKYRDFKIGMDDAHYTAKGTQFDLVPIDGAGAPYSQGEWDWAEVSLLNAGGAGVTDDDFLVMCGADGANTRSMILGYERSRAYPEATTPEEQNPNTSFLSSMFDVASANSAIIENATDRNDDAPYDRDDYPGNDTNGAGMQIHAYANIIDSGAAGAALGIDITHAQGGCFPCGLIAIDWTEAENNANLVIQVHMVPGNYRGYLAPPMTEM